ncbi:hypothetical protein GCM10009860_15930 [Microbacterium mitrae]|uniref:Uncharacterized protein n=1 Tax=Microbacterium mitrae TaxID=664640 RepID=A0A5C8HPU4_9MICO|nr:hypothetical protein [Microbacterium mitrae]TXK04831.1 hypothetical protein FVP60_09265 [Microbacterium mitrae]
MIPAYFRNIDALFRRVMVPLSEECASQQTNRAPMIREAGWLPLQSGAVVSQKFIPLDETPEITRL